MPDPISEPKPLHEHVPYAVAKAMSDAMLEAMAQGRSKNADFSQIEFSAAWEYLHYFRGAGKTSAYGPLQQAVNDEANSHTLRGFVVGWAMHRAMIEATKTLDPEITQLRNQNHRIMEQYITARGFYLRDDRSIREGDPHFEGVEEAYSLCSRDPFEREAVYGGPREWAVEQAYKHLTETT